LSVKRVLSGKINRSEVGKEEGPGGMKKFKVYYIYYEVT
jgi:hypothetical protein